MYHSNFSPDEETDSQACPRTLTYTTHKRWLDSYSGFWLWAEISNVGPIPKRVESIDGMEARLLESESKFQIFSLCWGEETDEPSLP